jgi:DNA polymerase/3'-5' exonuclease PolX
MHLYYAKTIADNLKNELADHCTHLHIAGSIRRKKEEVKDIEVVCIPKQAISETRNLFNEVIASTRIIDPRFEAIVKNWGRVVKGKITGRYMQIETTQVIEGISYIINIDLFMPQQHDYYRQLAIRTGSSEYARRFIASMWKARGWCGTEDGLRKIKECVEIYDKKWVLQKQYQDSPTLPPIWQSEAEVFKWLDVQYLAPEQRNL